MPVSAARTLHPRTPLVCCRLSRAGSVPTPQARRATRATAAFDLDRLTEFELWKHLNDVLNVCAHKAGTSEWRWAGLWAPALCGAGAAARSVRRWRGPPLYHLPTRSPLAGRAGRNPLALRTHRPAPLPPATPATSPPDLVQQLNTYKGNAKMTIDALTTGGLNMLQVRALCTAAAGRAPDSSGLLACWRTVRARRHAAWPWAGRGRHEALPGNGSNPKP